MLVKPFLRTILLQFIRLELSYHIKTALPKHRAYIDNRRFLYRLDLTQISVKYLIRVFKYCYK